VVVVMKVDQIGLCEQTGDIGAGVVDRLVSVNAQNNFFILLSPLLELGDQIFQKQFSRLRVWDALSLH